MSHFRENNNAEVSPSLSPKFAGGVREGQELRSVVRAIAIRETREGRKESEKQRVSRMRKKFAINWGNAPKQKGKGTCGRGALFTCGVAHRSKNAKVFFFFHQRSD